MGISQELRMTVYAALFAALMAAGAYIAIPIGPVPIVLQNFFVMLAALVLGRRWAAASVAVYLLAGTVGLPVFAGGAAGLGRIAGPTGGYLVGFLPAAWLIGWISEAGGGRLALDAAAMICGTVLVYCTGAAWLQAITGMGWAKAAGVGVLPFLPGDVLKIAAAAAAARTLRPVVKGGFETGGGRR